MKVCDAMTKDVKIVSPNHTVQDAAEIMAKIDAGVVPVGDIDKLVGMLTDRDIAIRAIARGKGPDCKVGDVMTKDVTYCYEDETIDEVSANLGSHQIRRIPVLNRDNRLVGILSLGDLALKDDDSAGEALAGISRPGGSHSQSAAVHQ
ncbi:MAG: CBS domain-containing protein [Hyphomicrobiaceae bacterium]|nr:CBS domain-containing protein [Rhodobiaceae bacterium]MCB1550356.1 CBS domain-containing protein [Hyphomicrobiaceae bacterium]MCC0056149.1 CBS domain-containing protein [Rhodobiaceae bacterium]